MILVGTTVVLGDGTAASGASLPTATAAGELLRSTGAGDDYEAVDQADVLGDSLAAVLDGEPAGATIISDGAGDVAVTSAAVSALLAAADAAGMRSGLALPASALTAYGTGGDTAWTGWAYSETGAAARTDGAVTGDRLRLTCTAGAAISPGGSARYTFTIPDALRSRSWRFRARLATFSGAATFSRWVFAVGAAYLSMRADGVVTAGAPDADSAASAIPTNGTGWIEALYTGGVLTLRYGTGTSSVPPATGWKIGRVYTPSTHTSEPSTLNFLLEAYDALAGTLTLEMDHATIGPTEDGGW